MTDEADPRDEARWLNQHFYDSTPWITLERRLAYLAVLWAKRDEMAELSAELKIGTLTINVQEAVDSTGNLAFVAAEAQVLLHQAGESLLRLVHAHQPDETGRMLSSSPAADLGRMRNFATFRKWIESDICDVSGGRRTDIARVVFGPSDDPDRADRIAEYLTLYGRFVLDSAPYNAAKHGLALQGEHSRFVLQREADSQTAFSVEGCAVTWLHEEDGVVQVRTRWYSLEALLSLVAFAAHLIEEMWFVARHRYLDEKREVQLVVPPLADLLGPEGQRALNRLTFTHSEAWRHR